MVMKWFLTLCILLLLIDSDKNNDHSSLAKDGMLDCICQVAADLTQ